MKNNFIHLFKYKGSAKNPYIIELSLSPFSLKCSCPGYKFKNSCKHINQILTGDVKNIIEGDLSVIEELKNNKDVKKILGKKIAQLEIENINSQIRLYLELYTACYIANVIDNTKYKEDISEYLNKINTEITKLAEIYKNLYSKEEIIKFADFNNNKISDYVKISEDGKTVYI